MTQLLPDQQRRAVELLHEYLSAPRDADGQTPAERMTDHDRERLKLIEAPLAPLLRSYLSGETRLEDFKTKIDSVNKQHRLWGFKGIKGQMFFNMVVNVAGSMAECDAELKAGIAEPLNEEMAKSRIRTFTSYVKRIGDQSVEAGGSKHGRPKISSVPFFLSYFWQLQNYRVWPVYYTNSVQTMVEANLWLPTDDPAEDYVQYKHLHEELADLFTRESGQPFSLYAVEHVFWLKGGNPYGKSTPHGPSADDNESPTDVAQSEVAVAVTPAFARLPESFVPPIVAILPRLAFGDSEIEQAAIASGTSWPRAFEKSIHAAFTILGYDATLLGQGAGRMPDGVAIDFDSSYAIIWDAKGRAGGYSMGTDDRAMREYVSVQSREMKRRKMLRNIYYVIVSSGFKDGAEDTIRMLKMETDISEVCLMEAAALVAMVDAKLHEPLGISLGPDGLQRLFGDSGQLTAEDVTELLG